MTIKSEGRRRSSRPFTEYIYVIRALILRDIKSRFMGSAWGYLISIGWPLSHILLLLIIHGVFGRLQPYGDSAAVWYSTGIVPFMAFSYTLRFVVLGLLQNAPLLSFPAVKVMDILFARALVEVLTVFIVFTVLSIFLELSGSSFIPHQPLRAFYALALSFVLGLSWGIIFACLSKISSAWNIVSLLFVMSLWTASGIFFVPIHFPSILTEILYLNPLIHVVDLFRSAYFDGFAEDRADWNYVIQWSVCSLFAALVLERFLRGRMVQ